MDMGLFERASSCSVSFSITVIAKLGSCTLVDKQVYKLIQNVVVVSSKSRSIVDFLITMMKCCSIYTKYFQIHLLSCSMIHANLY